MILFGVKINVLDLYLLKHGTPAKENQMPRQLSKIKGLMIEKIEHSKCNMPYEDGLEDGYNNCIDEQGSKTIRLKRKEIVEILNTKCQGKIINGMLLINAKELADALEAKLQDLLEVVE